jgi:hypothetical protein
MGVFIDSGEWFMDIDNWYIDIDNYLQISIIRFIDNDKDATEY